MKSSFGIGLHYLFIMIVLWGCGAHLLRTTERGNIQNCENRVLIASQDSEFKNSVVTRLEEALEKDACYLKRIDTAYLNDESARNYDAIAIVDAIKMMSIDEEVETFLNNTQDKEKIVVLVTTGRDNREVRLEHVDAISSASNPIKTEKVSNSMIAKVRNILELVR
ncbi:MAG: hypothetical protein GY866_19225 [Proteobacteria bacterium]|nr:hypothetical protein [Pseudomonadota bacterium]